VLLVRCFIDGEKTTAFIYLMHKYCAESPQPTFDDS